MKTFLSQGLLLCALTGSSLKAALRPPDLVGTETPFLKDLIEKALSGEQAYYGAEGAPQAQFTAGKIYYKGEYHNPQSLGHAFYWISRAAQTGAPHLLKYQGFMYKYGLGCALNLSKAFKCFQNAVHHPSGYKSAAGFYLAAMLYQGQGTSVADSEAAFEAFTHGMQSHIAWRSFFELLYHLKKTKGGLQDFLCLDPAWAHAGEKDFQSLPILRKTQALTSEDIHSAFNLFTSFLRGEPEQEKEFLQIMFDFDDHLDDCRKISVLQDLLKRMDQNLRRRL